MSDLYIDTDKGRLYITGDNAVEMIVPPGYKILLELVRDPVQKLPDIPPIEYDISDDEALRYAVEICWFEEIGQFKA